MTDNIEQLNLHPLTLYGYKDGRAHPIATFNITDMTQRQAVYEEIFNTISAEGETSFIQIENVMFDRDEFYMYQII